MANSKQKGSAFERTICKQLSLWISDGESDDLLWRSAMSGGTATVSKRKGVKKANQCGDISAIGEAGHKLTNVVILECKAYKAFDWVNLIYANKGNIAQFWQVLCKDCLDFKRQPFLILKQNSKPVLVCLNRPLSKMPLLNIHIYDKCFYQLDKIIATYTITEFIAEYK